MIQMTEAEYTALLKARDEWKEAAGAALARIAVLTWALGKVGNEISVNGCEGSFEDICFAMDAPQEDWCPYCRMNAALATAVKGAGT